MGRAETDQATDYLRDAAIDIKHALEAKPRWGTRHPDSHDRGLARPSNLIGDGGRIHAGGHGLPLGLLVGRQFSIGVGRQTAHTRTGSIVVDEIPAAGPRPTARRPRTLMGGAQS
jgi:hypothetical protein